MNTMNMPGFTADAALYKTNGCYQSVATRDYSSEKQRVVSQLLVRAPVGGGGGNGAKGCAVCAGLCYLICTGVGETNCAERCYRLCCTDPVIVAGLP